MKTIKDKLDEWKEWAEKLHDYAFEFSFQHRDKKGTDEWIQDFICDIKRFEQFKKEREG